ncbi:MAG: methyltransferase domain-containing protein [Methanomicrobia archaeon]|nr:methyltransferase domain-containing protein [Methanomicrobia archaeon]
MKVAEDRTLMELSTLLGIDTFMLVEESYSGQKGIDRTLEYLGNVRGADVLEVVRITDESDKPLGIAMRDKDLDFWIIFTDVIAHKTRKGDFEALAGKIKGAEEREAKVMREQFLNGVIEFYSVGLVNRLFCDCDLQEASFYPRDRIEALKVVLTDFLRESGIEAGETTNALEIGCGNGGATIALHELGVFPLAIDINRCEICKGLEEGVLKPERTIVLDCTLLPSFFGKEFDVVFGFMVGKLTPFERFSWEKVLRAVPKVLKSKGKVFFTVSNEEETGILNEILQDQFDGVIKENKAGKGYFDEWLYIGELKD